MAPRSISRKTSLTRSFATVVALVALTASVLFATPGNAAAAGALAVALNPTGVGYWTVNQQGAVNAKDGAPKFGDMSGHKLNQPIVGMAGTISGKGYWLVATDGGIFAFGDAPFYGSTGNIKLNQPIVGMASTKSGKGYWMVASDGGIFAYGDARFFGSTGNIKLNQPIVGMTPTASGNGYYLVATDGGIFAYGDAPFYGSTGNIKLNKPIVGMAATDSGRGYWMVASDGGIFAYGDAPFYGSGVGKLSATIGMQKSSNGYTLLSESGSTLRLAGAVKADPLPAPAPPQYSAGPAVPSTPTDDELPVNSGGGGAPVTIRYITPTGAGTKDGTSWANAGTLSKIPSFVKEVNAGGEVWLRADVGSYNASTIIVGDTDGVDGDPVVVRGVDEFGNSTKADIVGNRAAPYNVNGSTGHEVFRLMGGANHLVFSDLNFRNIGNGAFRVGNDISDLTLHNIAATNVRRLLENNVSGTQSASITGLLMKNVEVHGYSKSAVHIRYNSSNITLEDVYLDSEFQDGDDFAMGVHIEGTTHDVVLRRVTALNNLDTGNEYWNGDGFAAENATYNINFIDTYAAGNSDGGYDIKASNVTMTRPVAVDNKRNFRLWYGPTTVTDCLAYNPTRRGGSGGKNQVWVGNGSNVTMSGCSFVDNSTTTALFEAENNGKLTISSSLVTKDPAATLVNIGAGGTIWVNDHKYGV